MGVRTTEFTLAQQRSVAGYTTSREAAEAAGIPASTMARMEQGNDESLNARLAVCNLYKCTLERLHKFIDLSREARRSQDIDKASA